jgi:hypothetical protein
VGIAAAKALGFADWRVRLGSAMAAISRGSAAVSETEASTGSAVQMMDRADEETTTEMLRSLDAAEKYFGYFYQLTQRGMNRLLIAGSVIELRDAADA